MAVACLAIVTACAGGNDDTASDRAGTETVPDDGSSSPGAGNGDGGEPTGGDPSEGGDATGDIPDVCSLAADTIRGILIESNPHEDPEPTAERSTDLKDRPQCEWRIGASLPVTVAVGSYDDSFFHEGVLQTLDATPVPGLGDEAYMTEVVWADLSWRRDDFSVHLAGFLPDEIVAIAHEIDSQMPS